MAKRLDYTQYDWQSLLNQITNILKNYNSWSDAYVSSTGTALLELYSYIANMILYSIERTAEECYISTAQRYSSLVNMSAILNYTPKRNVSATGYALFTLGSSKLYDIVIPKYTSLSTLGGYFYVTNQDYIISPSQLTASISVIQGKAVTMPTYISAGGINQEILLTSTKIENSNINVVINNIIWSPVSSFVNSINNSTDYRVIQNLDGTLTIRFGDNVNGKAPDNGNNIVVTYIESDGLAGCVYSSGNLTTINDSIVDVQGTTITDMTVTNSSAILGGDDAETIEDIRYNAPRVFATGDRFVTKYDGVAIIGDYPSVASVNVWGENEIVGATIANFNVAYISMILQDWTLPNTDFKTTLSEYLYTKAPLTIKFTYTDPSIVSAYPVVSIYVKKGYSLTTVADAVQTELENQFSLGTNSMIGTNIRFAKVISAIQAVDGVSYCYLTLDVYQLLTYVTGTTYTGTLPLLPALAGSVQLYTGNTLLATDNGGTFTDATSYYVVSGTINHTTGAITASVNPCPSGGVNVKYVQNEGGDMVVSKTQIVKYYDSSITTAYVS